MTMKSLVLALSILGVASTGALAGPGNHRTGHINPYERVAIARSAAHLAHVKQAAWRDGRLSYAERAQIRAAEARHMQLVARARHS